MEEAARIRAQSEYDSLASDDLPYAFGSEEELDDLTFTEGDVTYEYESYYYPGRKSISPHGVHGYWGKDTAGFGQGHMLYPGEEPCDDYIDPMNELQNLVDSVSEYLVEKEEEINNYESVPKPVRRKLPTLPTDTKQTEVKESEGK